MKDVLRYTQNVFLHGVTTVKVPNTFFHLLNLSYKYMTHIPYKTACTNGPPDAEQIMFETHRRREELN
jgi:hypothetical protein